MRTTSYTMDWPDGIGSARLIATVREEGERGEVMATSRVVAEERASSREEWDGWMQTARRAQDGAA